MSARDVDRAPGLEHALFAGLDPRQLEVLAQHAEERAFVDGEYVVRRGDPADAMYVIVSGTVAIVREEPSGRFLINHLHAGEVFGELGLLLDGVRTASVVAVGPATLLAIPLHALRSDASASASGLIPRTVVRNINRVLARRMDRMTDATVALLRERLQMGQFFVSLICVLVLYTLALAVEHTFEDALRGFGPLLSIVLLALVAALCVTQIRVMGWSLDRFGVHLRGARAALIEAGWVTALVVALLTLGKGLLIALHPDFAGVPLIGFQARLEMYGVAGLLALGLSYGLLAPLQEFIARGILQTSLEAFLSFRRRTLAAIVLSNLLFAALHLHVSYTLAGLALASGLLWGALYARHRTLVGVSLSHVVLGLYTIYVLASSPV